MAPQGYWQDRCVECNHPRGRHTMHGGDGCTMRVARRRRLANGRLVTTMGDCPCRFFHEKDQGS